MAHQRGDNGFVRGNINMPVLSFQSSVSCHLIIRPSSHLSRFSSIKMEFIHSFINPSLFYDSLFSQIILRVDFHHSR